MHALGIFHEQSRADRDAFVRVHWDNIIEGLENNFEKQSLINTTYGFEYDYDSIMHYGQYYFRFLDTHKRVDFEEVDFNLKKKLYLQQRKRQTNSDTENARRSAGTETRNECH